MENTAKDHKIKPIVNKPPFEDPQVFEGEINLMDYFIVLWKHKVLLLIGTVLPAMIVGVLLFLQPSDHTVTYTYNVNVGTNSAGNNIGFWNLTERNFEILQSNFYSKSNFEKISNYLEKINAGKEQRYADPTLPVVGFSVSPIFAELNKTFSRVKTRSTENLTAPETSVLKMTLKGSSRENLEKAAISVRYNLENVIPLHIIQEQVAKNIREYNNKLAEIDIRKHQLELEITKNSEILAGLKKIEISGTNELQGNIVLQFNASDDSPYLPPAYHIQALQVKAVLNNSTINSDTANYKHFENLLNLSITINSQLRKELASSQSYNMTDFREYLLKLKSETNMQALKSHLASCVRQIENRISSSSPTTENPVIKAVAKATLKKSGIVFIAALMFSVFIAFLLESQKVRGNLSEKKS